MGDPVRSVLIGLNGVEKFLRLRPLPSSRPCNGMQGRLPKLFIAGCQHRGPETEGECSHDTAVRRLLPLAGELFGRLGNLAALVLKQQKSVILEPPRVPRFRENRVDAVPKRDLEDLQRRVQGFGQLRVKSVKFESARAIPGPPFEIAGKALERQGGLKPCSHDDNPLVIKAEPAYIPVGRPGTVSASGTRPGVNFCQRKCSTVWQSPCNRRKQSA